MTTPTAQPGYQAVGVREAQRLQTRARVFDAALVEIGRSGLAGADVAAIAAAFVSYITVINIHRAAETSRILGTGQSWIFVVRVGFAGIMMFPLGGGFSAGQALVLQAAMTGVGMAKAVYANAIQAVGPDAIVIARPMIPGTEQIVSGLIDSEL